MSELTVDNYYSFNAVSQSDLKVLIESPVKYRRMKDGEGDRKKTKALSLGNLVDCKILTPKDFDKLYIQRPRDLVVPSHPQEVSFCEVLSMGITKDLVEAMKLAGYKSPNEKDAKAKMDKFDKFLSYSSGAEGRTEYTFDEMTTVTACLSSVAQNPLARRLLKLEGVSQVPILFQLQGTPCRSLLDRLYIDEKKKVCKITDLKSTGFPVVEFPKSIRRFGYHFQAAFYRIAARAYLHSLGHNVSEWRFENYIVAVETKGLNECRVFEMPQGALEEGMIEVKQAFALLQWHTENGVWNTTKEEYENGHLCQIEWKRWR